MTDPSMWLVILPILLCVGAVAGTLAGLLGVGGGIVIVPVLYWLTEIGLLNVASDVAIHFAVATSLLTIIPTSISSARAHHKKGSIDLPMFRSWAPAIVLGALIGGLLAANVDSVMLSGVFGIISLIVVINMLNPRPLVLAKAPPQSLLAKAVIAGPIGVFSAMMGIGGGTLSVPVMTLLSFPVHRAVGTAALFGLMIAVPGIVGYALAGQDIEGLLAYSVGYINIPAALVISVATFVFAPLGVSLAHRLNARRLRFAFAVFLGVSSAKMLSEAFPVMLDASSITEGLMSTDRLSLYHLRVTQSGAPKVLLLGGSNFDLRLKRTFLETPLSQSFDIATYEPRGIGRSDQPDGDWTMEDYALDALAFLDALGWSDIIVLGESFGGMTALHLALLAPGRVRAMVIASATAGGPVHASYDISEFLALPRKEAAVAALCLQDSRLTAMQTADPMAFSWQLKARLAFEKAFADPSISSGGYARLLAARRGHDCTHRLDQITAPVTVIAGRFDRQANPDGQRALADGLPNSRFHMFDAGHGVLFNAPDAAATAFAAIQAVAGKGKEKETLNHE